MWLLFHAQFALPAPAKRWGWRWAPPPAPPAHNNRILEFTRAEPTANNVLHAKRSKAAVVCDCGSESFCAKRASCWLPKGSSGLAEEILEQTGLAATTAFSCLFINFLQLGYLLQVFVFKNEMLMQRENTTVWPTMRKSLWNFAWGRLNPVWGKWPCF